MEALTTDLLPARQEIRAYGEAAKRIYEPLRQKLEAEHWGKYITIHPINGDYAISRSHDAAVKKMQKKYPDVAFFTFRIGFRAVVHFGGRGASDGKRSRGSNHDQWKAIKVVLSNDEEPAVGTRLLQGSIATLDFVKNRLAIEEPIRAKRRKR